MRFATVLELYGTGTNTLIIWYGTNTVTVRYGTVQYRTVHVLYHTNLLLEVLKVNTNYI